MAKRYELEVIAGTLKGKRFSVPNEGLKLGRSSSNDISILEEALSRNHCLFEPVGPLAISVVDLASANGTFVNGENVGTEMRVLKPGDIIAVGDSELKVIDVDNPETPKQSLQQTTLDLGFSKPIENGSGDCSSENSGKAKHSFISRILWLVAAFIMIGAIAIILLMPSEETKSAPIQVKKAAPKLKSLMYEKIEADKGRIFRYYMTINADQILSVTYDDIPEANRHVKKQGKLNDRALARIREIFESKGWNELDSSYTGPSASDENALKSWRIRTVFGDKVRDIVVENRLEPESFKLVREALETFSRNELGIWAIQYSREQLLNLSSKSVIVGNAKWEERDVEYGNLSAAIDAYKEAVYYLETVNPKPAAYVELKEKLDTAITELNHRYKEQRFLADKAMNLGDWDTAKSELQILCAMVPNKSDPRHDEANAKLVDVENRLKKARKAGR